MNQVHIHAFCTYCDELHLAFANVYNDVDKWHPVCSCCHENILDFVESLEMDF